MLGAMSHAQASPPALTVLQSFQRLRPTSNPYLAQLVASLPPGVRTLTFDWRTALLGRYDVLHVHWPEVLFLRAGRLRSVAGGLLFALLLLRCRLLRVPIVRTAHNLAPHEERQRWVRALLRWCDRRTTLWIRLNPDTRPPGDGAVETILHGDYAAWFADRPHPDAIPGRLAYFGLIRPYKGVEHLLAVFRALPDPDLRLHVAGKPDSAELEQRIRGAAASDRRVELSLSYLDDDALARVVGESELVVLPYREMHNSGALLLALSLDRPVLVPRNDVNEELAQEVGPGWVHLYDGPLEPSHVQAALADRRKGQDATEPDLSRRRWPLIGEQHARAYARAVGLTGRRTAPSGPPDPRR